MDFLVKLFNLLTAEFEAAPVSYGLFHIVSIILVITLTVLVCKLFKDSSDKAVNILTACVWVVILSLEIYKQLVFGLGLEEGKFVWDYAWYAFPFQFCSSPLYILPIIAFTKNDKLRDACISYMMTFSLFAGLAVFCYPNDVFIKMIGINYQTMIHHGSQILMGVFYAVRYRDRFGTRHFFSGALVFVVMSFIAMTLNIGVYHAFPLFGIDETFNMFYISPYFDCTLPLLSVVYAKIPYVGFVSVYFFGFILCALIVYSVLSGLLSGVRSAYGIKEHEKIRVNRRIKTENL